MRVQLPSCGGEEGRTRGYGRAQVCLNTGAKRACVSRGEQIAENRSSDGRKCSEPAHNTGSSSSTVVFVWRRVDESVKQSSEDSAG